MIVAENKQTGSALIEVMVSMLVLLIGVMGFVELQHIGVKRQHDTRLREEGIKVINQLAETMRNGGGNGLAAGFYANPNALGVITDCDENACDPTQLMTYKVDIALREMVGFGANSGFVPVNRVAVCVSYNGGFTLAQIDFLWKKPTDINDFVAADCPDFGDEAAPTAAQDFSSLSTLVNL